MGKMNLFAQSLGGENGNSVSDQLVGVGEVATVDKYPVEKSEGPILELL